jgi:hypothetical protein
VSANYKRFIAYVICLLLSIIIGGVAALVVCLLGAPALAVAGAGAFGLLGVLGVGVKVIGPFDFISDNAPPTGPQ